MPTEVISLDNKQIRILFMGTPEIAVSMLERLWSDGYRIIGVVSQPDKKVGRKQVLQMPPVKQAALAHDIPCLLYTSPSPRDRQKSRMPSSA